MSKAAAPARAAQPNAGDGLAAPKEIAAAMNADEKLLWFSHPGTLQVVNTRLKSLIMAIPFFGIAIFWFNSYMTAKSPEYMSLIGWIFVAFGVYHVLVPAWGVFIGRFFTIYAITDKRILVIQIYPRSKVQAVEIKGIIGVTRVEGSGDRGTLHVLVPVLGDSNKRKQGDFADIAVSLLGINHAKRIEAAVNQLREAQQGAGSQRRG